MKSDSVVAQRLADHGKHPICVASQRNISERHSRTGLYFSETVHFWTVQNAEEQPAGKICVGGFENLVQSGCIINAEGESAWRVSIFM